MQKNIRAFGGDPTKVTIAGESSGGSSVDRLVTTMQSTPRPFRAAVSQSGQATVSALSRDSGPAAWKSLVLKLNCNIGDEELRCVQAADAFEIRRLVNDNDLDFGPTNDNFTQMSLPYLATRAGGGVAQVPYMIGCTAQEGNYLASQYSLNISAFDETAMIMFLNATSSGNQQVVDGYVQLVKLIQQQTGFQLFYAAALALTEIIFQCVSTNYPSYLSRFRLI